LIDERRDLASTQVLIIGVGENRLERDPNNNNNNNSFEAKK